MDSEIEIIKRFSKIIYPEGENPLWYGDDAWVSDKDESGLVQIVTCDCFNEGVHFDFKYFSYRDVAIKSINATLSDIAAMGAVPDYISFCLSIPEDFDMKNLEEFARGIYELTQRYNVKVISADTSLSKNGLSIAIFIQGHSIFNKVLKRKGASVGDIIAITGKIGNSWAGYQYLTGGVEDDNLLNKLDIHKIVKSHLNPSPQVEIAKTLADSGYVTSCADLSDSLSKQLYLLSEINECGVDIELEDIPLSDDARTIAKAIGINYRDVALGCGEDFRLLISIKEDYFKRLKDLIYKKHSKEIYKIGEIIDERGLFLNFGVNREPFEVIGFEHFKKF